MDITDLGLIAKSIVMDNSGQVFIDSKKEIIKKKNKRTAKRKERLKKLYALVRFLLTS